MKLQTRFSQIGLKSEWFKFFSEILNQILPQKIGQFSFLLLIKNYAKTIRLIDENFILQEAHYAAQQSSRRVQSPKNLRKLFKDCFI